MRKKIAVLILAVALLAGIDISDVTDLDEEAHADAAFSFNLFFDSLSPYGSWVPVDGYGYGWYPSQVGSNWQPYADGQWVWSNQGWTWISYEPWGWATYHYGRWIYDPYYGWLWIPGTVWAPAWVSWYQAPGYVGWSPLPPDNNFFLEIGVSFVNYGYGYNDGYYGWGYNGGHHHHHDKGHYYDNDYYAPGDHCVFVPQDKFTSHNPKLVALEGPDRLTVVRNVRNVTNIKVENNNIYNYGPDKAAIEHAERGKLSRVDIVDNDLTTLRGSRNPNSLSGGKYSVFRPNIEKKQSDTPYSMRALKNPGNRNSSTAGDTVKGNGLVQERNANTRGSNLYGNQSPDEYGVINRDSSGHGNNMNPDTVTGRQSKGDAPVPARSRGTDNVNPAVTNRSNNNRYNLPEVDSEPVRIKNDPAATKRQRNNYEPPVVQALPERHNTLKYSQPGGSNAQRYSNPGNRQTQNRAPVQQGSKYNANGYNAQRQLNESKPARNQVRNSSNTRKSNNKSGNNRYSNSQPPQSHTSPSQNTGTRSYNPGNTRSVNNNGSFVQNSGRGR